MRRLACVCLLLACNQGAVDPGPTTSTGPSGAAGDEESGAGSSSSTGTTSAPTTGAALTTGGASTGDETAGGVAEATTGASTGAPETTGGPPGDVDGDGVPDGDDSCPGAANPDQTDTDGDGSGDACDEDDDGDGVPDGADVCPQVPDPQQGDLDGDGLGDECDDDDDDDGIPDGDDVFPADGDKPGAVTSSKMYAHSASTLSSIDVATYEVTLVGDFVWPGVMDQMTDLAIDRHGQMFGVSFGRMYVCDPMTAECWDLGQLPASYNGLTWIPAGTLLPDKDALIGVTEDGRWYHLTIADQLVTGELLGSYGAEYSSAGDAFSIATVGTFAAVYKEGVDTTVIVTVDPLTGQVLSDLAVLPLSTVWGLAGWQGAIVAFDFTGAVAKVDPMTKEITPLGVKPSEWWGAAVSTVLPQ